MRLISFPVKDVKEVTIRTLWEPPSSFCFLLLLSPKPQHQALLVPHWPSPSQSSPGDAWSQLGRDTEPGGQSWTGTGTSGKPSAPVGIQYQLTFLLGWCHHCHLIHSGNGLGRLLFWVRQCRGEGNILILKAWHVWYFLFRFHLSNLSIGEFQVAPVQIIWDFSSFLSCQHQKLAQSYCVGGFLVSLRSSEFGA